MGPKTQELISALDDLASVLESDGNTHWCNWMKRAKARLLNSDYSGIEYLLAGYGGMGSFNDLVLGQSFQDGVLVTSPNAVALNEKLHALRNQAWELANEIKCSQ